MLLIFILWQLTAYISIGYTEGEKTKYAQKMWKGTSNMAVLEFD